jgi:hypothetical protein
MAAYIGFDHPIVVHGIGRACNSSIDQVRVLASEMPSIHHGRPVTSDGAASRYAGRKIGKICPRRQVGKF